MTIKHVKRCSLLPSTKELQIETIMCFQSTYHLHALLRRVQVVSILPSRQLGSQGVSVTQWTITVFNFFTYHPDSERIKACFETCAFHMVATSHMQLRSTQNRDVLPTRI